MEKQILEAEWIECSGEAHKPGGYMIDHCGICMPWWGKFPICPECKIVLPNHGRCKKCRNTFRV